MTVKRRAKAFGTALLHAAAETRLRLRKVSEAVEALLNAEMFDGVAADALAHRHMYADVASALLRIVACPGRDLIPALLKSEAFAPYRLGVAFGAIPSEQDIMQPVTVTDLHLLGTPEARLALIASGGDDRDWILLDRRGRAVFALRHLVHAMRDR